MRYEDWNNGLNQIDMSFIEEYINEKCKYKKKRSIRSLAVRMSAAAACAALIFTAIIVPIRLLDFPPPDVTTSGDGTVSPPPIFEKLSFTADDIDHVMKSIDTYGSTNAYRKVYVPDAKYLYVTPIPYGKKTAYIYEYQETEPKSISKTEFNKIASDIFTSLDSKLGSGSADFTYEIDYSEKNDEYDTDTVIAGINVSLSYSQSSTFVYLSSQNYGECISLKGESIKVDENLSDEEILKSLEPVKKLLFEAFNIEFSNAKVARHFLESGDGAFSLIVSFYNMTDYAKPLEIALDYVNIEFSKSENSTEDTGIFEIRTIYYRKDHYPVEQKYTIKAENKLISISEAEKLLYKGYVFGGHSCRLCMEAQDKISFKGYDFVEIEYIFDRDYSVFPSKPTVAIPFYAFYKKIGKAENGNMIYAKTYVPAVEVSGLDEYFKGQIKNHK